MDAHGSTVWRVCVLYFRASADAQDAFQDTMVKYALADTVSFNDDEHRKAWLIRVAANTCKDMLRRRKKVRFVSYEEQTLTVQPPEVPMPVDEAIERLQPEYRVLITLYYLGGFDMKDLASMFSVPVTTIKSRLTRAKKHLSLLLKQDEEEKAL